MKSTGHDKILTICFLAVLLYTVVAAQGSSDFRIDTQIETDYSSIILPTDTQRDMFVSIENQGSQTKYIKTYLEGVNATFVDFNSDKTPEYALDPSSSRSFLVRLDSGGLGKQSFNVTTQNVNITINQTESIPVYIRDYNSGSVPSEVSGIGLLHLMAVFSTSIILYFVLL